MACPPVHTRANAYSKHVAKRSSFPTQLGKLMNFLNTTLHSMLLGKTSDSFSAAEDSRALREVWCTAQLS